MFRPGLDQGTLSAHRLFSCKFSHKIALVRRPCAFWLRRLAQSLRREFFQLLAWSMFIENSRMKWLLWDVHAHFDCAGLHKVLHFSWQAQYFVDLDRDLCDVHVHFDQNRKQQITLAALLTTASEGVRGELDHLGSCVLIGLSVAQAGSVLGGWRSLRAACRQAGINPERGRQKLHVTWISIGRSWFLKLGARDYVAIM